MNWNSKLCLDRELCRTKPCQLDTKEIQTSSIWLHVFATFASLNRSAAELDHSGKSLFVCICYFCSSMPCIHRRKWLRTSRTLLHDISQLCRGSKLWLWKKYSTIICKCTLMCEQKGSNCTTNISPYKYMSLNFIFLKNQRQGSKCPQNSQEQKNFWCQCEKGQVYFLPCWCKLEMGISSSVNILKIVKPLCLSS